MVGYTLRGKGSASLGGHTCTKAHTAELSVRAQILSTKTQDHRGPYQDNTEVSTLKRMGAYLLVEAKISWVN